MVGTIEQALEARDRRNSGDRSEFDLKMIGTFVRLEIPMTDIHEFRQVRALLRDFADRISRLGSMESFLCQIGYHSTWPGASPQTDF